MKKQKKENPIWAWFVLIGGGLFLLRYLPGMLLTLAIPIKSKKDDHFESSFL